MATGSKIIDGLEHALSASKCDHEFTYQRSTIGGGEIARCGKCRVRFTAWPGTIHYDEIVTAKNAAQGSQPTDE